MRTLSCSGPQGRRRRALICQAPCRHIPLMSWLEEKELSQSPPLTFLQQSLPSKFFGMGPGPRESFPHCLLTGTQPLPAALLTAPHECQLQSRQVLSVSCSNHAGVPVSPKTRLVRGCRGTPHSDSLDPSIPLLRHTQVSCSLRDAPCTPCPRTLTLLLLLLSPRLCAWLLQDAELQESSESGNEWAAAMARAQSLS